MEINIQNLIDDARCYEAVRDLRWSEKTYCPDKATFFYANPSHEAHEDWHQAML